MGGPADQPAGADDVAGDRQRQVVLAEVQHVGARGAGDVGPVVDGEQRAVPPRRVGEHLERGEFAARLQRAELLLAGRALVAQLDDVDAARQRGVGELGEVTAFAAGVGAQVEPGGRESLSERFVRIRHIRDVSDRSGTLERTRHGSPGTGD